MTADDFRTFIREKGAELFREMPWRDDTRPYCALVSEMMLQQTQVARVIPKFQEFMTHFPDIEGLAAAELAEVLRLWQGLGYNRRAKFLHEAAREIVRRGQFPDTRETLKQLAGVGENTAGAILAYGFNRPEIFVETNIRTVYFHHFFQERETVSDAEVREKLAETLDQKNPREFYWALMDYGADLKARGAKYNAQSRHYKKQSPLAGSVREVRGAIIRALTKKDSTEEKLREMVDADARFDTALQGLLRDNLIEKVDQEVRLKR